MPLEFHNTLTGKRERFRPLTAGKVSFYTCGPTVYDYAHIGNFRSFLAADLLRRWLESPLCQRVSPDGSIEKNGFGYDVTHVMNLTDVGHMTDDAAADGGGVDKMESARKRLLEAKKTGALPEGVDVDASDPRAIAEFYAQAFVEDAKLLGLKVVQDAEHDPSLLPRPTRFIKEMLEMILALIERNHAYIAPDGAVYFEVQSFPDYGALSGNTLDKLRAGAGGRVADAHQAQKKHPADFMLWKPDPIHLMRWDPSEVLGKQVEIEEGYPGWHIECSVMAQRRLGDEIDIHSGGEDNIFPHHECEIAQSRGASGKSSFARFWFHPRHLFVEGEKMSKSAGAFFTIRDLVGKGFEPAAIRLELIKTHYRANANFTEQGLRDSARMIQRWRRARPEIARRSLAWKNADKRKVIFFLHDGFARRMNDDLNISGAIGYLNERINSLLALDVDNERIPNWPDVDALAHANDEDVRLMDRPVDVFRDVDDVLGVLALPTADGADAPDMDADEIESLIAERNAARKDKDFATADEIRDRLAAMGIEIKDGPTGTTWKRRAAL